ncbi:DNA polymerase III subunit delta [Ferriphaselus sp. R-1]|uniref:DNA polymerase III subunit delta n=1 Tax=Ferriphaselus sp. R-1 TaxID=1485544 RepID=UPI000554C3FE|nr:DNA polymerase III subunit delta [Ferriphaselus sp. R-1]
MKLSADSLPRHLASGLKPLYVIHGDAQLLALEAADSIRAAARAAGYAERDVLTADKDFRWAELRDSAQSLSLFADRKVIDLRIPSGKPGTEGGQALQEHCARLTPDVLTLITLPRLDGSGMKSKWFAALEQHGVTIAADDIPRSALPAWIAGRLQRHGQSAERETLEFLADRVEGNLLAAWQEIQKLALLYPAGALSFDQVKDAVMDVARYDVFKLAEAMLSGNAARYARILDGLRAEGTATVLILWALTEEVRTLVKLLGGIQRGDNLGYLMKEARVWGNRQESVGQAVRRIRLPQAEVALRHAARLDKTIKGLRSGDVWDELLQLGLRFAKT